MCSSGPTHLRTETGSRRSWVASWSSSPTPWATVSQAPCWRSPLIQVSGDMRNFTATVTSYSGELTITVTNARFLSPDCQSSLYVQSEPISTSSCYFDLSELKTRSPETTRNAADMMLISFLFYFSTATAVTSFGLGVVFLQKHVSCPSNFI